MEQKTPLKKRKGSRQIGQVAHSISAHLCKRYAHLRHGRIFTDWRLVFPDEVGLLYKPVRLHDFKLKVRTSSSQAALLTYFAPSMIERINQYFGGTVVHQILAEHGAYNASKRLKKNNDALPELPADMQDHTKNFVNTDLKQAMDNWGRWLVLKEQSLES